MRSRKYLLILPLLTILLAVSCIAGTTNRITVSEYSLWDGPARGATATDPVIRLMKQDRSVLVKQWSGIELPGGSGRTPLMMAIAGQTAPDMFLSWFHIVRTDIEQGFTHPLNEWIGEDGNDNGRIDPSEAKWPGWKDVPPLWRQVATSEGKVHALPWNIIYHMGIIYRTDLVQQAGLDPNDPPETWDEFLYWCQKLTDPGKRVLGAKLQRGQRGFAVPVYGFCWLPWMQSVGGTPVVQFKTSPKTNKQYAFPMAATSFVAQDTGEDLADVESVWRASLASKAAREATGFYHKLRWQRWIRDPKTHEPVNLTPEQVESGKATLADGRIIKFDKKEVITGVVRIASGQRGEDPIEWLSRGEVAMVQWFFNDLSSYRESNGINPDLLGVFPIPAGPGGKPVVQFQRHYAVMSEGVGRRSKRERDAVWKVMLAMTSKESYDENVRQMVAGGFARFVNPSDLERLGFKDYVPEVPRSLRKLYDDLETGSTLTCTEPFMGFWAPADLAINNSVLSILLSESGDNFDYVKALKEVERMANTGTMFARKPEDLAPYRPAAWLIFAVVAAMLLFFVAMVVRTNLAGQTRSTGASAGVHRSWFPWLLLAPALGLVALWGYYPLARGLMMAFQDYHIVGDKLWVGLDNFIGIFLNPDFYVYVRQTIKFVILNLLLVFTAPIILSLLLSEIPRGKQFWRSVFFIPQLTSGLVIALLWKLMYNPTEAGLLNQVMGAFGLGAVDWLGNPQTAMLATIIPSVWAGMGISSLIYLAALKGIPDELYEAADLDGAGVMKKLRSITLPQLLPLIIINFVGAFIATVQSMGNIFLLTFGGPGKETMVMGMAIWIEAYNNLRFSTATSMAWIMGSALIGFAYLQIRILRSVEFRRVDEV